MNMTDLYPLIDLAINPGDAEAQGLAACWVAQPTGMMDLVTGTVATRGGTADPMRASEAGTLDAYFDGNGDSYSLPSGELIDASAPFTIVWEGQLDAFVDAFPQVAILSAANSSVTFRLFYSNNSSYNDISFGISAAASNLRAVTMPSGIGQSGERHWGVLVYNGAGEGSNANWLCYINGQLCAFTTAGVAGSRTDENRIGGTSDAGNDWNGVLRQYRIYPDRQWSEAEAIRFWRPETRDSLYRTPRRSAAYFGTPAGAGQTVAVGQVSETNAAQAITARKTKAIGQVTETDAAQAIAVVKARSVGQVSESDAAQAISALKHAALGQVSETDLAQTITVSGNKVIAVDRASETDTAQAMTALKTRALGQSAETDAAQAITARKSRTIGLVTEADTAQAISVSGTQTIAVAQVLETDTAQAIAWAPKRRLLGQVVEIDVAQLIAVLKTRSVGQALETEIANAVTWSIRRFVAQAIEADEAQSITAVGGGGAVVRARARNAGVLSSGGRPAQLSTGRRPT